MDTEQRRREWQNDADGRGPRRTPGWSGRLGRWISRARTASTTDGREAGPAALPATVTLYPDGPYIVRGAFQVVDAEGREVPLPRKTVALCRCGLSEAPPWCDGNHRLLRREFAQEAVDRAPGEAAAGVGRGPDHGTPVGAAAHEQAAPQR